MRVIQIVSKLVNIRTHEWPRLLLFCLMNLLLAISYTWSSATIEASFLKLVGLGFLPWFFVVKAALSIPAVALYTAFADRVANNKLLIAVLLIGMAGIATGILSLSLGMIAIAYLLLYIVSYVPLSDIFAIQWQTYRDGFYDSQSIKRIIPILGTASRIAGIIGGLTLPLVNHQLSAEQILLLWLVALGAVVALIRFMPNLLQEDPKISEGPLSRSPVATRKRHTSYSDNVREGYRYVAQSSFLRWMALVTLVMVVLLNFLQYQYSQVLLQELKTTQNISNFLGQVYGLTNLLVLPIQLFLLSRIVSRVGVGNANLIFPVGMLLSSASLIALPGTLTAALAYFGRTTFYNTFGASVNTLLYNAVALRVKGRARAFITGLVSPIGSVIGGGLLLLLPALAATWLLPWLLIALSIVFIAGTLIIRREYAQALIQLLQQEDYSFLLSQETTDLTVTDPAMLAQLQKRLLESQSHEFTLFMAQLIGQIGGDAAIPILIQASRTATEARTRSAIIDVMVATNLRGDAVQQLYTDLLADPDPQVRQSAVTGLEQLVGLSNPVTLAQMLKMAQEDPDLNVRVRILSTLIRAPDFHQLTPAVQLLDQLLADSDSTHRAKAVRVLGQAGDEPSHRRLLAYLNDPADEVRLEAAQAVESLSHQWKAAIQGDATSSSRMSNPLSTLLLEKITPLLHDPVERIRQAAIVVLGQIGLRQPHIQQAIVSTLADPSPQLRAAAADALAQAGKSVVPLVHLQLDSANTQLRKMATFVLGRINRREYGPLIIGTTVTANLLAIYRNHGTAEALSPVAECPSVGVLQSALREQNQQLVDEIFYFLTAFHDAGALKLIRESLQSDDARTRANALEALESLTSPQTASLIGPLFEPEASPDRLFAVSKETWDMEPPNTAVALRNLASDAHNPWFRAATTFALGEIGARLTPPPPPAPESPPATTPEPPPPSLPPQSGGRGRVSPLDALKGLTDDSGAFGPKPQAEASPADTPSPRPAENRPRRLPTDLFAALDDQPKTPPPEPAKPTEEPPLTTPTASPTSPALAQIGLTRAEIEDLIQAALNDPAAEVRTAAQAAKRLIAGSGMTSISDKEELMLSPIEKIIFLKEVPFFQGMTVDQLRVLANVCEEEFFAKDTRIYNENDPGGVLYVVISGRVGIEQEKRKGSFARLANIEAHSYFGEMNLFDNSPRSTSAVAIQDTLTLRLRREPLIALARQHPDLSLELINVLSQRLRETSDRVAELTRTRPRELHKLFDQYE